MSKNILPFPARQGEITEDGYSYATRLQRVYSVTDVELDMLVNGSWWTRRRIGRRVREETTFDA